LAVDASGVLYVSDTNNHLIRKITPEGVVSTIAGTGAIGAANGTGTLASFNNPGYIAVDGSGNLWVTDSDNHRIRKITPI
jgi:DNA-binding beta-propeller fold protein YncE